MHFRVGNGNQLHDTSIRENLWTNWRRGHVIQMRLNRRNRRALRFGALLACSIIAVSLMIKPAAGQSGLGSGRIEGTVMDESGATVADATVTARSDATGVATVQSSDSSGHFLFPYLTPGAYHVSVEKAGFKITQVDS